jgi:hypothetical protein
MNRRRFGVLRNFWVVLTDATFLLNPARKARDPLEKNKRGLNRFVLKTAKVK